MTGYQFQSDYFSRYPSLEALMQLFDDLPGAFFFAKDVQSRFVYLNQANLAIYDTIELEELLGKTDGHFHPQSLATAYVAEDREVMEKGVARRNELWLVPYINGPMQWFVCTKTPLFSMSRTVIGIAGVMYPIDTPEQALAQFGKLGPAISIIERDFHYGPINFDNLAKVCGLSATHFNRLFKSCLHMSPTEYVHSLRVQEARRLLATSGKSVLAIAQDVGFYDQSHFAKRFKSSTGMSPAEYRKFCRKKDA